MKTPWMNYKKMQEITSTQKSIICSSKVYRKSIFPVKVSKEIYRRNSTGVPIKFINQCWMKTYSDILENKNKSCYLDQSEQFLKSSANMEADQFSKTNQADVNQKDDKITDFHELRINPVNTTSSESSTKLAHCTIHDPESTILDEDYEKTDENVQDPFITGEINNNAVNFLDFIHVRVPVVIGEYNLESCLDEVLTFKEKVKRIKEISNQVVLTNCKITPTQLSPVIDNGTCQALEGYLFLEGTIHQNIEYVPYDTDEFLMNDKLCSMSNKIPFSITEKIDHFLHPPVFGSIAQTTFDFLDQNNTQIPQQGVKLFHSIVYNSEQPYCRMISSKTHQMVWRTNTATTTKNHLNQSVAVPIKYQLHQKIVVEVFVHLLQIQHIRVKLDSNRS